MHSHTCTELPNNARSKGALIHFELLNILQRFVLLHHASIDGFADVFHRDLERGQAEEHPFLKNFVPIGHGDVAIGMTLNLFVKGLEMTLEFADPLRDLFRDIHPFDLKSCPTPPARSILAVYEPPAEARESESISLLVPRFRLLIPAESSHDRAKVS
jgi:hypothetical protein